MRKKIIKRVAISLMAATMVLGTMTSVFAYTTKTVTEKDDDGKNVAGLAAYVNGGADYTKPVDEDPQEVTPTAGADETDKPTDEQPTDAEDTTPSGAEDTTPSDAEDTVVYGDVNDDGVVDIKDVALIKRKLAGWDVVLGPQDKAADSDSGVEDTTPAEDSTSDESTSEDASAGSV